MGKPQKFIIYYKKGKVMAVKIRMTRMGRRHRPFFRINAVDSRTPRDGRILEKLGHFDPMEKDESKQLLIDLERVKFWLEKGAIPSDTMCDILKKHDITCAHIEKRDAKRAKALSIARKSGKPFTKAERIAAEKAAEQAKIEAEEAAKKAEEEAKAKAEAEAAAAAEAEKAEQAEGSEAEEAKSE